MKKRFLPPVLAVVLVLLSLSAGSLLTPDRAFSANENRYLQQAPEFTWRRLFSGKFTAEAEDYTSDQIWLRDFWMGAKSTLQRLSGAGDINGVYLASDGSYVTRVTEDGFDDERYAANLEAVRAFFDACPAQSCRLLLAPSAQTMREAVLPANAPTYDAESRYRQAQAVLGDGLVDVRQALSEVAQPYYFTDHHWTTAGAYAAYGVWAEATGHAVREAPLQELSAPFRGTLYSKVLLPDSLCDTVAVPKEAGILSMEADGETYEQLLFMDKAQEKDVYQVFMGGNYARAVIRTGTENGKHLLVIKDSFANCFVPFLLGDYETITVLDLRYYKGSVQEPAGQSDDVLVLYELSGFAADTYLFKLKK